MKYHCCRPFLQLETEIKARNALKEYKVLERINCHMKHFENLYRSLTPEFMKLNRYGTSLPFKHNRVRLSVEGSGVDPSEFSDFVNASFVATGSGRAPVIAASAPTDNTSGAFWQMIFEQGRDLVLMVCALQQGATEQCSRYFGDLSPDNDLAPPKPRTYHFQQGKVSYTIECLSQNTKFEGGLVVRRLKATKRVYSSGLPKQPILNAEEQNESGL